MRTADSLKMSYFIYKNSRIKTWISILLSFFLCSFYLLAANAGILYSENIKKIGSDYLQENPATVAVSSTTAGGLKDAILKFRKIQPKSITTTRYGITLYDFTYEYEELEITEGRSLASGENGCLMPDDSGYKIGDEYTCFDYTFTVVGVFRNSEDLNKTCIIDLLANIYNSKLSITSVVITYDYSTVLHKALSINSLAKRVKAPQSVSMSDSLMVFISAQKKSTLILLTDILLCVLLVLGTIGLVFNEIEMVFDENRKLFNMYHILGAKNSDIIKGLIFYTGIVLGFSLCLSVAVIAPVVAYMNAAQYFRSLLPDELLLISQNSGFIQRFSWISFLVMFVVLEGLSVGFIGLFIRKKYSEIDLSILKDE